MPVEQVTLGNTQGRQLSLQPWYVISIAGEGEMVHGTERVSRLKLRPEAQVIGPYMERTRVEIMPTGETTYTLYDLFSLDPADLASLDMLPSGTRLWLNDLGRRVEMYREGVNWVLNSPFLVGTGAPNDGDGRPDGTVYFQIP